MPELAKSYYSQAEKHALKANELAVDAREVKESYEQLKDLLKRWDEIMSHNPITAFTFIFVLVAIGEYLVSIELYTDLLPRAPFIIPLVIIGISIVISHWLAYKFVAGFRLMEFDDKRQSTLLRTKTDEQIWAEINSKSNRNFYVGLIAAIGITIFIYFMSMERVEREIAAAMRIKGFGFYDALPVLFYIAEIITGVYIVYLLKRLSKSRIASKLKNDFDDLLRRISNETESAISSFEKAEVNGFDIIESTISESIHIAFYRNKNCNPSDEVNYIAEPQNIPINVNFKITRTDKTKPLAANVHMHSEYNFAASGACDDNGLIDLSFSSFGGDVIKKIIVEFSDGVNCEDSGIYPTDNIKPHAVVFRV